MTPVKNLTTFCPSIWNCYVINVIMSLYYQPVPYLIFNSPAQPLNPCKYPPVTSPLWYITKILSMCVLPYSRKPNKLSFVWSSLFWWSFWGISNQHYNFMTILVFRYSMYPFYSKTEANIKPFLFSHTLIKDKDFSSFYLKPSRWLSSLPSVLRGRLMNILR